MAGCACRGTSRAACSTWPTTISIGGFAAGPGRGGGGRGYYMAASRRVRAWLSRQEWDYWYEGKPAACDLRGPDGRIVVRAGTLRSGGSYWRKASRIAVWNTTMDEHNYMARRWKDFIDDAGIDGAAQ